MNRLLSGKRIVVTGAARGLGYHFASACAAQGACVVMCDILKGELAESAHMQKNMLDVSVDCIKILRTDGTLIHMNQSGCDALGVAPDSGCVLLFNSDWGYAVALERRFLEQQLAGGSARIVSAAALFDEAAERALGQIARRAP